MGYQRTPARTLVISSTRIPASGNVGVVGLIAAAVLKVDDAELVVLFGGLKCRVSTDNRRSEAMANDYLGGEARWRKEFIYVGRRFPALGSRDGCNFGGV